MILEDLQFIFKKQLDDGVQSLFFMLIDGTQRTIERHPSNELENLLPCLDAFTYQGNAGGIPRFAK